MSTKNCVTAPRNFTNAGCAFCQPTFPIFGYLTHNTIIKSAYLLFVPHLCLVLRTTQACGGTPVSRTRVSDPNWRAVKKQYLVSILNFPSGEEGCPYSLSSAPIYDLSGCAKARGLINFTSCHSSLSKTSKHDIGHLPRNAMLYSVLHAQATSRPNSSQQLQNLSQFLRISPTALVMYCHFSSTYSVEPPIAACKRTISSNSVRTWHATLITT